VSGTVAMRAVTTRAAVWAATAVVLPCWVVAAATGGLYLLYAHHLLGAGIAVPGALPLEGLAGHAAQPLLRAAAAWLGAGAAAGCLLGAIHRPRPGLGLAAFAAGAAVVVVLTGAAGRALTINQPLGPQVVPELGSTAAAFAWGVLVCGASVAALGVGALGVGALAARPAE
jgi:hypothetical protein